MDNDREHLDTESPTRPNASQAMSEPPLLQSRVMQPLTSIQPSATLPPMGRQIGNYGLTYDHVRQMIVYTQTDYHACGKSWAFKGETWQPFTTTMSRFGDVSQCWRTLWDAQRKAVVAWAWDTGLGPIGIVVEPGTIKTTILNGNIAKNYTLTQEGTKSDSSVNILEFQGELPTRYEDTDWEACDALFGHDPLRGVTVAVNPGGLWELNGATWTSIAGLDLSALPLELSGEEAYGSLWNERDQRIVFWGLDKVDDSLSLSAWDGCTLVKLSTEGLPDDMWDFFGSSGFAVGEHPQHGLVVLFDGELFGMTDPEGGFQSLGTSTDAPPPCKEGQMAFDPSRGILMLGPIKHEQAQACFHLHEKNAWRLLGRSLKQSVLRQQERMISGIESIAINMDGNVFPWDAKAARFQREGNKALKSAIKVYARAWENRTHVVTEDGAVFRLDQPDGNFVWNKTVEENTIYGGDSFPLGAFDEMRNIMVVWGPCTQQQNRKDMTFVCDGKAWRETKKSAQAPEGLNLDMDQFNLFYCPAAQAVTRISPTEIAFFDGAQWQTYPLENGSIAFVYHYRDTHICSLPCSKTTLIIHWEKQEIIRLIQKETGFVLEHARTFVINAPNNHSAHTETNNDDADENKDKKFEAHVWFDPNSVCLMAHNLNDEAETLTLNLTDFFAEKGHWDLGLTNQPANSTNTLVQEKQSPEKENKRPQKEKAKDYVEENLTELKTTIFKKAATDKITALHMIAMQAYSLRKDKKYSEAIRFLDEMLVIAPPPQTYRHQIDTSTRKTLNDRIASCYTSRGICQRALGKFTEAIADLNLSLRHDENLDVHICLLETYAFYVNDDAHTIAYGTQVYTNNVDHFLYGDNSERMERNYDFNLAMGIVYLRTHQVNAATLSFRKIQQMFHRADKKKITAATEKLQQLNSDSARTILSWFGKDCEVDEALIASHRTWWESLSQEWQFILNSQLHLPKNKRGTDQAIAEIINLVEIRTDMIADNKIFKGKILLQNLKPLEAIKRLSFLCVSECGIQDISALSNLTELAELDLARNNITDITPLRQLHALRYLDLSDNSIEDVSSLSDLPHLCELSIGFKGLTSPHLSCLSGHKRLKKLRLELHSHYFDNFPVLDALTDLTFYDSVIESCQGLDAVKNLESLRLPSTVENIDALAQLPSLRKLEIFKTKIKELSPLSALKHLESVKLSLNKYPLDVTTLATCSELKFIECSSVIGVRALASLPKLERLRLTHISPTADFVRLQADMPHVQYE